MEGGTTFHFLDASPAEALETAREAADGQDVRIGGGPTDIRDFLSAGLVDYLHAVVVRILLGRGVPLWDGLEGLQQAVQRFAGWSQRPLTSCQVGGGPASGSGDGLCRPSISNPR